MPCREAMLQPKKFSIKDCKAKYRCPAGKQNIAALQGRYVVIKIVFHQMTLKRNIGALQGSYAPVKKVFHQKTVKRNIGALQGSEI